ncbi:MAG: IPT/TIG domain-containing protein [Sporolactobacillus sp.]
MRDKIADKKNNLKILWFFFNSHFLLFVKPKQCVCFDLLRNKSNYFNRLNFKAILKGLVNQIRLVSCLTLMVVLSLVFQNVAFADSAPQIMSVTPTSALTSGGDTITIEGLNFSDSPSVMIGTQQALSVERVSDTLLNIIVPATQSAGLVNVEVINNDSQTAILNNGLLYVQAIQLNFSAVSGGATHTLALNNNHKLFTWGDNTYGQLGNNNQYNSSLRPVAVDVSGPLKNKIINKIASGYNFSLALDSNGNVYAWGDNTYGQLGDGTTTSRSSPVNISSSGVLSGKTITAIFAGNNQSFAIDSNGSLYAWGRNDISQLGDGTTTNKTAPELISGGAISGKTITKVAAGDAHTLALDSNGNVYAWGYNVDGRLGNNTTTNSSTPVLINDGAISGKTIIDIAAGYYHSVALDNSGNVYTWGNNTYGQLGNDTNTNSSVPVAVYNAGVLSGKIVTSLSAGQNYTLALDSNGQVYAWGDNNDGQLGDGTTINELEPINVSNTGELSGKTIVSIDAAGSSSDAWGFAIDNDGELYSWGDNYYGQLGNDSNISQSTIEQQTLNTGEAAPAPSVSGISLASGYNTGGDTITITGNNFSNPVDVIIGGEEAGDITYISDSTITATTPVTSIVGTVDVTVKNEDGQFAKLADSFTYKQSAPTVSSITPSVGSTSGGNTVKINGSGFSVGQSKFKQISAGNSHVLAINNFGNVYSWGNNNSGQLGDGSTDNSITPVAVDTSGTLYDKDIISTQAGYNFSLALDSNGNVYAWGDNTYGQLGDGTTTSRSSPVNISSSGVLSGKTITAIFAGNNQSFAIDSNGSLYAWGRNDTSQLGDGTTTNKTAPELISGGAISGKAITKVAAGDAHTLALDSNGNVYAWGYNVDGRLGNNTTTNSSTPVLINDGAISGKTIIDIAAGYYHSVALDNSGNVYTWGNNTYGQLGNDTNTNSSVPVAVYNAGVLSGKIVTSLSAGQNYTLALDSNGQVYAWGDNNDGQLGDGTYDMRDIPVYVSTSGTLAGHSIASIEAAGSSSDAFAVALDTSGNVYSWGYNYYGQLGNNDTNDSNDPVFLTPFTSSADFTVTFKGKSAQVISVSSSQIVVTAPSNDAGMSDIKLSATNFDSNDLTNAYEYMAAPSISSVSPTSSYSSGGDTITIIGANFASDPKVSIGDEPASNVTLIDSSTITATIPADTAVGAVDVVVTNRDGQMATLRNGFSYLQSAPVITSVSPSQGSISGGNTVTLSGSGFTSIQARYSKVADGYNHVIALDSNGNVYAWGDNTYGQLGDGTTTSRSSPVNISSSGVLSGKVVTAIFAGNNQSFAIDSNGSLYAWGRNDTSQLGDGTTTNKTAPELISGGAISGKTITKVAAGDAHTLALDRNGNVYAWGYNVDGRLGNNTTTNSSTPILINDGAISGKTIIDIAAGYYHSVALDNSGNVYTWGNNTYGQLGNDTNTNSSVPVAVYNAGVLSGKIVTSLSAGQNYTLALDSNGQVYAWGDNNDGQLGDGTTINELEPINVSSGSTVLSGVYIKTISAGKGSSDAHTLALDNSGNVYSWGYNYYGQLGNGSTDDAKSPQLMDLDSKIINSISTGNSFTSILDSVGRIFSWGDNTYYQLGNGTTTSSNLPIQSSNVQQLTSFTITIGGNKADVSYQDASELQFTAPAHSSGLVDISLEANYVEPMTLASSYTYLAPPTISSVSPNTGTYAGGDTVTIAGTNFKPDDTVTFGGLAATVVSVSSDGTTLTVTTPAHDAGSVNIVVTDIIGQPATLSNDFTYLYPAPTVTSITPNQGPVSGNQNVTITGTNFVKKYHFTSISQGDLAFHECGVSASKVYCWGDNSNGELGDGATGGYNPAPVAVDMTGVLSNKTITQISTGAGFTIALASDGTVYSWGVNTNGQLGNGTTTNSSIPVAVTMTGVLSGKTVTKIVTTDHTALALTSDGGLYTWGYNSAWTGSQVMLGNGSSVSYSSAPVAVTMTGVLSGKTIVDLGSCDWAFYVLDSNGNVYSWGSNDIGQLGNNTTTSSSVPVAVYEAGVLKGKKVVQITTGGYSCVLVLTSDGTVYGWGTNGYQTNIFGTLGSSSITSSSVPIAITASGVLSGKKVVKVLLSGPSALALVSDNTLYAWGYNGNGQLGTGTTTQSVVPVAVNMSGDLSGRTIIGLGNSNCWNQTGCSDYNTGGSGSFSVLASNGSIYSWGWNGLGSLGNNTTTDSHVPVQVVGLKANNIDNTLFTDPTVSFNDFNGAYPLTGISYVNNTTLAAVTPAHIAGTVDLKITNYDGQSATLSNAYTYIAAPSITNILPSVGSVAGGNVAYIIGSNFTASDTVTFDGTDATNVTYINSTTLMVTVPAHSTPGSFDVVVSDQYSQTSTLAKGYTYQLPSPTLTKISPAYSTMDGNVTVTITGSGFVTGGSSYYNVYFGTTDGTEGQGAAYPTGQAETSNVTVVNSTTMTVTVPAHAVGLVDVTVGSDNGYVVPATLSAVFTYLPDSYKFLLDSDHKCSTDTINADGTACSIMATQPGSFTIEALDKNGDPVVADSPIILNLSTTSSAGAFSVDGTGFDSDQVTIKSGSSTATFFYHDGKEGKPTIKATDAINTTNSASDNTITITSQYKILVTGVTNPTNVGVPSSITVQAVNYQGVPQADYQGTIHFTSTDLAATLPSDYTFTAGDHGRHTFTNGITFGTVGTWNVTATDTVSSEINGTQYNIVVGAPASGTIAQLVILTNPQSFSLDSHSGVMTVQTQDVGGVPIPVTDDTTVYLKTTSSNGYFSIDNGATWQSVNDATNNAIPLTIKAGTTYANFMYKDLIKGKPTVSVTQLAANNAGWTPASQVETVGVGAPAQLGLSSDLTKLPVGAWIPIDVNVEDQSGDVVTSNSDVTALVSATTGITYSYSADGSNPTSTISPIIEVGSSTTTIYVYSTKTGAINLTVSDARTGTDLLNSTTTTFNFSGTADRYSFVNLSSSVHVYTSDSDITSFMVESTDQFGNVLSVPGSSTVNINSSYTLPQESSNSDGGCSFMVNNGSYSSSLTTDFTGTTDSAGTAGAYITNTIYMKCSTVHDPDPVFNSDCDSYYDTVTKTCDQTKPTSDAFTTPDNPAVITASDPTNTYKSVNGNVSVLANKYDHLVIVPYSSTLQTDSSSNKYDPLTAGNQENFVIEAVDKLGNPTIYHSASDITSSTSSQLNNIYLGGTNTATFKGVATETDGSARAIWTTYDFPDNADTITGTTPSTSTNIVDATSKDVTSSSAAQAAVTYIKSGDYRTIAGYTDTLTGSPTIEAWDQSQWQAPCYGQINCSHAYTWYNPSLITTKSQTTTRPLSSVASSLIYGQLFNLDGSGTTDQLYNYGLTVFPAAPDHYAFTTKPHITVKNTMSGAITVYLQDYYNNLSYYRNDQTTSSNDPYTVTNSLTSSSQGGYGFYSDSAGSSKITSLSFKANTNYNDPGDSTLTFYYKDDTTSLNSASYNGKYYLYDLAAGSDSLVDSSTNPLNYNDTLTLGGGLSYNSQNIRIVDGYPDALSIVSDNTSSVDPTVNSANQDSSTYAAGNCLHLTVYSVVGKNSKYGITEPLNAVVLDDTNINLSDSAKGTFYSDSSCSSGISSITMPANTDSVELYYVPTKANLSAPYYDDKLNASASFKTYSYNKSSVSLADSVTTSNNASLQLAILPTYAYKLAISGPTSITVSTSNNYTVNLEDLYGNLTYYKNVITAGNQYDASVGLSSDNTNGQFSKDGSSWSSSLTADLPASTSSLNFFYKGGTLNAAGDQLTDVSALGSQVLTADFLTDSSINSGYLTVNVVGDAIKGLTMTPASDDIKNNKFTIEAGKASHGIRVQLCQSSPSGTNSTATNNSPSCTPAISDTDYTVYLQSTGSFTNGDDNYTENGNALNSTVIYNTTYYAFTVQRGSSYGILTLTSYTAGSHNLLALDNIGSDNAFGYTQAVTVTPNNGTKLAVTSAAQTIHPNITGDSANVSSNIDIILEDQYGNPTYLDNNGNQITDSITVNDSAAPSSQSPTNDSCATTGSFHGVQDAASDKITTTVLYLNSSDSSLRGYSYPKGSVYYADTNDGYCTLSFQDSGYTTASQDILVREKVAGLKFVSPKSQSLEAGQTSSTITVQTVDRFGNNVTAEVPMTIDVNPSDTTDSSFNSTKLKVTGSTISGNTQSLGGQLQMVIEPGSDLTANGSASFTFTQAAASIKNQTYSYNLEAGIDDGSGNLASRYTPDDYTVNVTPGVPVALRYQDKSGSISSLSAEAGSYEAMTVQPVNAYSMQTFASGDTLVNLTSKDDISSTAGDINFFSKSSDTDKDNSANLITSIVIKDGTNSSATFYFQQKTATWVKKCSDLTTWYGSYYMSCNWSGYYYDTLYNFLNTNAPSNLYAATADNSLNNSSYQMNASVTAVQLSYSLNGTDFTEGTDNVPKTFTVMGQAFNDTKNDAATRYKINVQPITLTIDEAQPTDTVLSLSNVPHSTTGSFYLSDAIDSNGKPTTAAVTSVAIPAHTTSVTVYYWQSANNNYDYYNYYSYYDPTYPDRLTTTASSASYSIDTAYSYAKVVYGNATSFVFSGPSSLEQNQTGTYTVTSEDAYGNIVPLVNADNSNLYYGGTVCAYVSLNKADSNAKLTSLSTSSRCTASSGQIALAFSEGQTQAQFTYKSMTTGTNTIKANDGSANGQTDVTITPAVTTKLVFTSPTYTSNSYPVVRGAETNLNVCLQSSYGVYTNTVGDVKATLTSASASALFKDSYGNWSSSLTVTIPAGSNCVDGGVGYKDAAAPLGSTKVTATDTAGQLVSGTGYVDLVTGTAVGYSIVQETSAGESNTLNLERGQIGDDRIYLIDAEGNHTAATTSQCVYITTSASQTLTTLTPGSTSSTCSDITGTDGLIEHALLIPTSGYADFTVSSTDTAGSYTVSASSMPIASSLAITANQVFDLTNGDPAKACLSIINNLSAATSDTAGCTNQASYSLEFGEKPTMEVSLVNKYGVVVPAVKDTFIDLSSSIDSARFQLDANDAPKTTKLVTIANGSEGTEFVYSDVAPVVGTSIITAAQSDNTGITLTQPDYPAAQATINLIAGAVKQLVFTSSAQTTANNSAITATHPSKVITVEIQNQYGYPTYQDSDYTVYPRINDDSGVFSLDGLTNWNVTNLTIPAGSSDVSFYYKDETVGTHTITVKNSLDISDSLLTATQNEDIIKQVMDHFAVTNISTPEHAGTPSSVVVFAEDSDNYVVKWYAGTITFSADSSDAIYPAGSYTFDPATDNGIHTFTNGIAFKDPGIKAITATDTTGSYTGIQSNIIVLGANTNPVYGLKFISPPDPYSLMTGMTSDDMTIELVDQYGSPTTDTLAGGYPIHLVSSSATGQFSTDKVNWSSTLDVTVDKGLSFTTTPIYYRDKVPGSAVLTGQDYIADIDNPNVTDATLNVNIDGLNLDGQTTLYSKDVTSGYINSKYLFSHDHTKAINGYVTAKATSYGSSDKTKTNANWTVDLLGSQHTLTGSLANGSGLVTLNSTAVNDSASLDYTSAVMTPNLTSLDYQLNVHATETTSSRAGDMDEVLPISSYNVTIGTITTAGNYATVPLTVTTTDKNNTTTPADITAASLTVNNNSTALLSSLNSLGLVKHISTGTYQIKLPISSLSDGANILVVRIAETDNGLSLSSSDTNTIEAEDSSSYDLVASTTPTTPSNPTNPTTPVTPPAPSTPAPTNPSTPSKPTKPGKPTTNTTTANNVTMGGFLGLLRSILANKATPYVVPGIMLGAIVFMAILLIYQAYKEVKQARYLLAIIKKDRQTVEDKESFLSLASHYLRTPVTLISSAVDMLTTMGKGTNAALIASLMDISSSLKTKIENILTNTKESKNLSSVEAEDIKVAKIKTFTSPIFWLPVILSIVLTILVNWAITKYGHQTLNGTLIINQVLMIVAGFILLYTGVRLLTMRRARKEALERSRAMILSLDQAKMDFINLTYHSLTNDILHMSGLNLAGITNEFLKNTLKEGTIRLSNLVSRFATLSSLAETAPRKDLIKLGQLIDQTMYDLAKEIDTNTIRVNNLAYDMSLTNDRHLLGNVLKTVIGSMATKDNIVGNNNTTSPTTNPTLLTINGNRDLKNKETHITINGPLTKDKPAENLFSVYSTSTNEQAGTATDDSNLNRLDLYLDRMIVNRLGGDITATKSNTGLSVDMNMRE